MEGKEDPPAAPVKPAEKVEPAKPKIEEVPVIEEINTSDMQDISKKKSKKG